MFFKPCKNNGKSKEAGTEMKPEKHYMMSMLTKQWRDDCIEDLGKMIEYYKEERNRIDETLWVLERVFSWQTSLILEKVKERKE